MYGVLPQLRAFQCGSILDSGLMLLQENSTTSVCGLDPVVTPSHWFCTKRYLQVRAVATNATRPRRRWPLVGESATSTRSSYEGNGICRRFGVGQIRLASTA